jgi:outer membrane protein OmpA-like peptidoglycan-associated protein
LTHVVQQTPVDSSRTHAFNSQSHLELSDIDTGQEKEANATSQGVTGEHPVVPQGVNASASSQSGIVQRSPIGDRIRKFLEDYRVDITVGAGDLPIVGQPTVGARRNSDRTWTVIFGNEEHRVSPEELEEILKGIGQRGEPPGQAEAGGLGSPISPIDPTDLASQCGPGEFFDFLTMSCRPEVEPRRPPRFQLEEPFQEPLRFLRPSLSLFNTESTTIDRFELDSAEIPALAGPKLDRMVELINRFPEARVRIDGHTDSSGTPGHNQALSERRAETIKTALKERGVLNPERLVTRPFGERILLNEETTTDERGENRRVEIWFQLPPGFEPETFRLQSEIIPPLPPLSGRFPFSPGGSP